MAEVDPILGGGGGGGGGTGDRRRTVECEFCGCKILPNGDHTGLSDKAKKLRDLEGQNEKLSASMATLKEENEVLKKKIADLEKRPEPKKSGFSFTRAAS